MTESAHRVKLCGAPGRYEARSCGNQPQQRAGGNESNRIIWLQSEEQRTGGAAGGERKSATNQKPCDQQECCFAHYHSYPLAVFRAQGYSYSNLVPAPSHYIRDDAI